MALLGYSRSLVRKTPEQIRDVQAMFDDVRAYLATGKLIGAQNFQAGSIPGSVIGPNAIDTAKPAAALNALGMLGNVVGSQRAAGSFVSGASPGLETITKNLNLTGVLAGDLVLCQVSWKMAPGSVYFQKQWRVRYIDNSYTANLDTLLPRTYNGTTNWAYPQDPATVPDRLTQPLLVARVASPLSSRIEYRTDYVAPATEGPATFDYLIRALILRFT